jgi:hypothetical protein
MLGGHSPQKIPSVLSWVTSQARIIIGLIIFFVVSSGYVYAQPSQEPRPNRAIEEPLDTQDASSEDSGSCLTVSAIERQAKVALYTGKRNKARTLAEKSIGKLNQDLQESPSSKPILGALVLAQVYEESEGNFPKALFWVRQALEWIIKDCGERPKDLRAQQLHRDLLLQESMVLGSMDRRQEQLNALERYESIYQPPKNDRKIWPLVKLGRFEEARQIGLKQIKSDNSFVRNRAFNGLMAVECEARNRKASYDWGMRGHIDAQKKSCVIALNMGLASRQCFKFDEEERFNRLALNAAQEDCSSSPYIQSSATYLIRGEFQKSISALSSWVPSTAMEWSQSHMRVKARRAELMFGLGVWYRGLKEIYEVVTYPDRSAGTDSASEEMLNLESYVLYWALLEGERIAAEERRAVRSIWGSLKRQSRRVSLAWRQWRVKRQVIRYATYQHNLIDLIRPYFSSVMPWYSTTITHILGGGVLRSSLASARRSEVDDYPEIASAYFDGFEAELAWVEGDYPQVLMLIERAIASIPKAARLLRYRLTALRWAARSEQNNLYELDDDLHLLLSEYPLPLRLLDLKIPVKVSLSGGDLAEEVHTYLKRSPRFIIDESASLSLQIIEGDQVIKLCLIGARGNRYRCAETLTDLKKERALLQRRRQGQKGQPHDIQHARSQVKGGDKDQRADTDDKTSRDEWSTPLEPNAALRLVDRAHQELFAPLVELTQKEMDTLDGNIRQLKAEDALDMLSP